MEYANDHVEYLISQYIHHDRNARILRLRLIHGMTYEEVAEAVGMSTRQICRIVGRESAKLYRHLEPPQEPLKE